MCKAVKGGNGWSVVTEGENRYVHKGVVQDKHTVRAKAEFVRGANLFGAAIYPVNYDDVHSFCGDGNYPLLNEVRRILVQILEFKETR